MSRVGEKIKGFFKRVGKGIKNAAIKVGKGMELNGQEIKQGHIWGLKLSLIDLK